MTIRQIDTNRRTIIKFLSLFAGIVMFVPRALHASLLLSEFPGSVGYPDWYYFVLNFAPRNGETNDGPRDYPEGISLDRGQISIKVSDSPENDQVVPITVSFDDSNLPQDEWCSELTTILGHRITVVDELGRYFSTKAHQTLFKATFSKQAIPSISMRFKLSSKSYRIAVVARIRKQNGEFHNIAQSIGISNRTPLFFSNIFATNPEAERKYKECYNDELSNPGDCVKSSK